MPDKHTTMVTPAPPAAEARRRFPGADLSVSPLCLGTMTFGTPVAAADAVRLVHHAIAGGINFIDTANSYEGYARVVGSAGGTAEEILGKALHGHRHEVVLATKVGMKIGPEASDQGLSRAHIRREIERSLRRLATDYVDLYYLHKPDPETPLAETIETMDGLAAAGRIRYWGLSNFSAAETAEVLALCGANGWRRPIATQPPYSLLKRGIEADLVPLCTREGVAIVPYQVLQSGLLSGKYREAAAPAGSRMAERPEWVMPLTDDVRNRLISIAAEASDRGRTMLQHALLEPLALPGVVSLIVGVRSAGQLDEMIAAVGGGA